MTDLLTIGDSSIDLFMKISNKSTVPEPQENPEQPVVCFYHGSKIPVEDFETSVAGNALNVAVGTTKLGIKTSIYSEIGDDNNGERMISELKNLNIDTKFLIKNPGTETDIHAVIVFGGDRTIFSYHGERSYKIRNWDKPKFIYYTSMGNHFEDFQKELITYLKKNPDVGLAFNPGTIQMKKGINYLRNILKITDILFVNKEEAEKLTESTDSVEELHKKLHLLGPKLTVITRGTKGSTAYDGKELVKQKIYSDDRVLMDRTGAGDAFSSGFISAILYGKPLKEAIKWGTINSGNVIKKIGSIEGLTDKKDMERIVKLL